MSSENELFHRSRTRVKDYGEVFTLCHHVTLMIDQLGKYGKDSDEIWSDEKVIFFEPTCGHGNIVEGVLEKRLEHLYKSAKLKKIKNPAHYSISYALNNLWAIDIDEENIEYCRTRVLSKLVSFFVEKLGADSTVGTLRSNIDFFAHIVCAIRKQIFVNEAISAMSDEMGFCKNATATKTGTHWIQNNKHVPIDYSLTWVVYFRECRKANITPIEFTRAKNELKIIARNKRSKNKLYEICNIVFLNEILDNSRLVMAV